MHRPYLSKCERSWFDPALAGLTTNGKENVILIAASRTKPGELREDLIEVLVVIIDALTFFSPQLRWETTLCPVHSAEQFVGVLDRAGIHRAVVCPPDWRGSKFIDPDYVLGTRSVLELAERHRERVIPFVRINPNWGEKAIGLLRGWAGHPLCKGLVLNSQWDYFPVNSKALVDPVMAVCEESNLAVAFFTGYYPAAQPMHFLGLAERWPGVRIALIHAGQGLAVDALLVAQRSANISFICTPIVSAATIQTAIREIGSDRVMVGSELPYEDPGYSLQKVRALPGVREEDKAAVLGGSAARWLGLS